MERMSQTAKINIAMDGPAGAGKSTVAKRVAQILQYVYIDTGAMYRAVAWKIVRTGRTLTETEMVQLAEATDIVLLPGETQQRVLVDGEDVSDAIRTPEISNFTAKVATIGAIRELLVRKQQQMAERKGIVMDGRDICTHVLPGAEVKLFLTASVAERANRRYRELVEKQQQVDLQQIQADIEARDLQDRTRDVSPLVQAEDALLIDSSDMTIDEVVAQIVTLARTAEGYRT
jgi:cytidylate kinase